MTERESGDSLDRPSSDPRPDALWVAKHGTLPPLDGAVSESAALPHSNGMVPPDASDPPPPVNGAVGAYRVETPETAAPPTDRTVSLPWTPPAARAPADDPPVPPAPWQEERGDQIFIDAWDAADREAAPVVAAEKRRSSMLLAREAIETLLLALVIFLAVRAVVQNFRVEGASMNPTYASGQYVLVNKALYTRINLQAIGRFVPFIDSADTARPLFRAPKRGEVVVFHPPLPNSDKRDFIKRVIGMPGDHVQVREGTISINGHELNEPYLKNVQTFCGGQWCDVRLGPDEYFVMGDNRANSSDSRLWGPVSGSRIIGKTWLIYLPRSDFGPAPNQAPILLPASAGQ